LGALAQQVANESSFQPPSNEIPIVLRIWLLYCSTDRNEFFALAENHLCNAALGGGFCDF
jgi:hypothetical protein